MEKVLVANAANAALANPQARADRAHLDRREGQRPGSCDSPTGRDTSCPANLAPLPAGRVYQLWAVRSDAKISLGVLGAVPEVSAFRMDGPVVAYAVTEEAAGGVATTENQPVVVGYVKA